LAGEITLLLSKFFFICGSLKNCKKNKKTKTDIEQDKINKDRPVKTILTLIIINTINKTVIKLFPSL
jgi:hypothetical protein